MYLHATGVLFLSRNRLQNGENTDGIICMMPVAVYPKNYIEELREEMNEVKAKIDSGEQPVFDTVDELFEKLEEDECHINLPLPRVLKGTV